MTEVKAKYEVGNQRRRGTIAAWLQVLRLRLVSLLFGVGLRAVAEVEEGSVLILECEDGRRIPEAELACVRAQLKEMTGMRAVVLQGLHLSGFIPPPRIYVVEVAQPTADDLARSFTHSRPEPDSDPPSTRQPAAPWPGPTTPGWEERGERPSTPRPPSPKPHVLNRGWPSERVPHAR